MTSLIHINWLVYKCKLSGILISVEVGDCSGDKGEFVLEDWDGNILIGADNKYRCGVWLLSPTVYVSPVLIVDRY